MRAELLERALKLSVEERLRLIEEIWGSIAATQDAEPLTHAQIEPMAGIRRAQALVRSYIPEGRCLSDELVEERRSQE